MNLLSYRESGYRERPSRRPPKQKKYERSALILDILENTTNRKDKHKGKTIIQALGTTYLTLLEIIPINASSLTLMDEILLDKEHRSNVQTIIGRIPYDSLTNVAQVQLEDAITKIVEDNEARYVEWLNKAPPINIRLHSLQVIKGIGPKAMSSIIQSRKEEEFSSFKNFEERTGVKDIKDLIINRIQIEITDDTERHHLFSRPPPKIDERGRNQFNKRGNYR